ncbi:MAG: hypothetical protein K9J76_02080 [Polaromonas sp.]|nr:hypothetical protein [Polaromonas sp.]
MNSSSFLKTMVLVASLGLALYPMVSQSEDIDLFVGASAGSSGDSNILIVLDNTSNWARQSQQWPDGIQQGQAEAQAIKEVFADEGLTGLNIGLMEFVTSGNANDNGGFIRIPVLPVTNAVGDAQKAKFKTVMDTIDAGINSTNEKRNSGTPYGNLMYDAFNYFGGRSQSQSGAGTLSTIAINGGYSTNYSQFQSPLSCTTGCAKNFVIFISNPNASGPTRDDATNTDALTAAGNAVTPAYTAASTQLGLPNFNTTNTYTTPYVDIGPSDRYESAASCMTAVRANNYNGPSKDICKAAGIGGECFCEDPVDPVTTTTKVKGVTTSTTTYTYTIKTPTLVSEITPNGTVTTDANPFNADEWAKFMYVKGVPVAACTAPSDRQFVTTYTVDVYNAQPNAQHTSLMLSMAKNSGGKYFAAKNKNQLIDALKEIVREIQSVNSTFASASLPINATNRSQNANQVYIGMFRPDPDTKPRWLGNLKRYQVVRDATSQELTLGDKNGAPAINLQTGFISDCATSYYTTDSGNYWEAYSANAAVSQIKPDASTKCTLSSFSTTNPYSDIPDGPRVEKGSVAQIIRMGNTAPTDPVTTPTWSVNRTVKTSGAGTDTGSTTLSDFTTTSSALSDTLVRWVRGEDTENEDGDSTTALTKTRASLHGDIVHSRPLPVNYSTTSNDSSLATYYGANDGTFRAVDSVTGKELWAYVAPEFYSKLDRLRTGTPLVTYDGTSSSGSTRKDYFFDGSIGLYQNADNSKVWIYPTMRRGGRMIYAFDVSGTGTGNSTPPSAPTIKWKFGCPQQGTDTGCSSDSSDIGQTWSTPQIAKIKDGTTTKLVAIVGGGYDTCEDTDSTSRCGSGGVKGNKIYVLDAETGALLKSFYTRRSVIAEVALVDTDGNGFVDYGYVGDTGGNLYRIAFSQFASSPERYTALSNTNWNIALIARTSGSGRKFQFQPSLFSAQGTVYVALGSGDRERPLETNYPYTTPVLNRFYVYRDCLSKTRTTYTTYLSSDGDWWRNTDNLDDVSGTRKMTSTSAVSTPGCSAEKTLPTNCDTNMGWFVDLDNGRGEQTVTSSVISGGMVTFSTNRPLSASSSATCANSLGEARGYWLNLFSGAGAVGVDGICGDPSSTTNPPSSSAIFVGGGLPPSPVLGIIPVDGVMTNIIIGAVQKSGGVSTAVSPQQSKANIPPFRKKVYDYIKGLN